MIYHIAFNVSLVTVFMIILKTHSEVIFVKDCDFQYKTRVQTLSYFMLVPRTFRNNCMTIHLSHNKF